jgi:iron complex transport system ATP-binding protein
MKTSLMIERLSVPGAGCHLIGDLSACFLPGQLVAVIGPNGAGKTTFLRALAGLVPSKGMIKVDGVDIERQSRGERARLMSYLPQGHQVHWPLRVRDVVALGRFPHGLHDLERAHPTELAIIEHAMARTDVLALADRSIQSLSGGERARVMMARVFAVEAPILLADEPISAFDPRHQLALFDALRMEAKRGVLVIVVTHDLGLAARFADEILLLHRGMMAGCGTPEALLTPERLADIYGIRAFSTPYEGEPVLVPWAIT